MWERTLLVETSIDTGTAFTVDGPGGQYLVTAAHLIPAGDEVHLTCTRRGVRREVHGRSLPMEHEDVDIVVVPLSSPLTPPDLPLPAKSDGMWFGQDAYFLGFPLGLGFDIGDDAQFPLPKWCLISGQVRGPEPTRSVYLLDGFNDPGFSGGPVVYWPDEDSCRDGALMHDAAVVSGFWPEDVEQPEGWNVRANSGIITAEPIDYVVEAINRAHGVG